MIEQVDDFAELGSNLLLPVRVYSSGMRARLAFALTLAIDFDCYLIDEVIAVGDQRFQEKCHDALFGERKDAAMILVAGVLLLVPGFFTDGVGLLLLVPPIRRVLFDRLARQFAVVSVGSRRSWRARQGGEVVEGEFEEVDTQARRGSTADDRDGVRPLGHDRR